MTPIQRCPSPPKYQFFPAMATLLSASKTGLALEQIHAHIIRKGLESDNYLLSRFISRCTSFSLLPYAVAAFQRVHSPNTCLWNSLLKAYCDYSSLAQVISFFSQMRASGTEPDGYTFSPLIKRCSADLARWLGKGIHGLAFKIGFGGELFVCSSLVDMYGKCGEVLCAREVFDGMPIRNEVSWTAMIVGYASFGDLIEARRMLDSMPRRSMAASNAMISGYVKSGDVKSARKLFDEMPERNIVSFTSMIDGCVKCGEMVMARALFDQCPERDVVLWSALMSGYTQNGMPWQAVDVFREMESSGMKPDEFTMVNLMSACSQLGHLELAKWVDSYVSSGLFNLNQTHVAAALLDMNAKCGNMDRAMKLFNDMDEQDLVSYCSIIQGMSAHGQGDKAVHLFQEMLKKGVNPDNAAFTIAFSACSLARLVEEGLCLFDTMVKKYSIDPTPDHYACMVDLLGRSGHLKAAYDLIQSMPMEPHAEAWGALLGSCRLHCDIELGELVGRRLQEMEPTSAGSYVLLSNIYAAANRWLDVFAIRDRIKEKCLRKIPGCSRI
ncbi:hypothetical protein V2J09_005868 [Rumex salicifolius]